MDCTIIAFPIIPLRRTHDVTEVDLASRIRRGDVTAAEVAERFERIGFAEWMLWRGLPIYRKGVLGHE